MVKMIKNGLKFTNTLQNSSKWSKIFQNGSHFVQNSRYCPKRFKIIYGQIYCNMVKFLCTQSSKCVRHNQSSGLVVQFFKGLNLVPPNKKLKPNCHLKNAFILYQCYYPHTQQYSLSPVCAIKKSLQRVLSPSCHNMFLDFQTQRE